MPGELKTDLERYRSAGASWDSVITNPAVWAQVWYRFGRWVYHGGKRNVLWLPVKIVYRIGYLMFEVTMQMCLPASASIGGGLVMTHAGGIRVHPEAVIGANCDLAHHVTIGASAMGRKGVPKLGNNVYIGSGATIVGKIIIGDGVKIAANTLVMNSVPAGCTVMGVPGRIVMRPAAAAAPAATPNTVPNTRESQE